MCRQKSLANVELQYIVVGTYYQNPLACIDVEDNVLFCFCMEGGKGPNM